MRPGALAVGARVVHAHHDRVRDLAGPRRAAIAADVADDHGAVAEAELARWFSPIRSRSWNPKAALEPGDSLAHIGIDQDRDDGRRGMERFGFIAFQPDTTGQSS